MRIISVRTRPEYAQTAIRYFQRHWASDDSMLVYEDSIMNCLSTYSNSTY